MLLDAARFREELLQAEQSGQPEAEDLLADGVIVADCAEVMWSLASESVDMAFVVLPYNPPPLRGGRDMRGVTEAWHSFEGLAD